MKRFLLARSALELDVSVSGGYCGPQRALYTASLHTLTHRSVTCIQRPVPANAASAPAMQSPGGAHAHFPLLPAPPASSSARRAAANALNSRLRQRPAPQLKPRALHVVTLPPPAGGAAAQEVEQLEGVSAAEEEAHDGVISMEEHGSRMEQGTRELLHTFHHWLERQEAAVLHQCSGIKQHLSLGLDRVIQDYSERLQRAVALYLQVCVRCSHGAALRSPFVTPPPRRRKCTGTLAYGWRPPGSSCWLRAM